jgi:hypothetical protein
VAARLDDPVYNREMAAADRLSGTARLEAFSRLDAEIMRNQAPWAPLYEESRWLPGRPRERRPPRPRAASRQRQADPAPNHAPPAAAPTKTREDIVPCARAGFSAERLVSKETIALVVDASQRCETGAE